MKKSIDCTIDRMASSDEEAWVLSLPLASVPETIILLASLIHGKLPKVKFADKTLSAAIWIAPSGYALTLDNSRIAVSKVWVEAVLGMLLDVCLNGWSDIAHLDQDFENKSVTVLVLPPEK